MKKIKILFAFILIFCLTGCFRNDSMDNISIVTSVYPIEYVVKTLYGEHSDITSIYPSDSEIKDFEITKTLLKQYSDNNLFIFNGLSDEKNYIKTMLKNNKDLKIIDVTSNMTYEYALEELWLDPNNLLTIANNIKKGFNEYISSTYLINEVNENYDNLKIELTNLDGKFYSAAKSVNNPTIIVSSDAFKFLEKYGIKVISLDSNATNKDYNNAKECVNEKRCNYIYIKYGEELNNEITDFISKQGLSTLELYTMTNLYNLDTDKSNYTTLMNQNLESLKLELYK